MPGTSRSTDPAPGPGAPEAAAPVAAGPERLAFWLDQAVGIPGTRIRVGLDPIIGLLLPGAGDALTALLASYIVLVATRSGLPRVVVARMIFNVAVDLLVGSVPVLGDLFDAGWKANVRNVRLLRRYAGGARRAGWADWAWLMALLGGLGLLVGGVVAVAVYAIRALV
ncbi:MAG TPA: DUF4112 domain-containing protein [Methylomirabilota bacterium]|jgi:hypothetical protein|nr:DUF4112 domain-containing protein [Methylomirabilota bacterium]